MYVCTDWDSEKGIGIGGIETRIGKGGEKDLY